MLPIRSTASLIPSRLQVDIGKREVVGYGVNGEESYIDDLSYPFPAIRFKEDSAEIAVRTFIKTSGRKHGVQLLIVWVDYSD